MALCSADQQNRLKSPKLMLCLNNNLNIPTFIVIDRILSKNIDFSGFIYRFIDLEVVPG